MKEEYINLLKETNREGIEDLIKYLEEKTDFFTAPASTVYHLNYEGGLLEHSMNVYKLLNTKMLYEDHLTYFIDEGNLKELAISCILVSLLHDICKANYYKKVKTRKLINGVWQDVESYITDDQFPLGHGEKSVILAQRFIKLTDEEIMAIRWHMGGFEPKENHKYLSKAFSQYRFAFLLHQADMEATYLVENK